MARRVHTLCFALLLCGSPSGAQTLAHPGWRGNGIASEAWWKHAAFVRFDADTTFAQATATMDAMSEAGVDSLILPDLLPTGPMQAGADGASHPFAARFGTEDDLDALLREASARRMHVLLHEDLLRLAGNPGELRYWMSRGIAGFDVGTLTAAGMGSLQLLRMSLGRFPGRRLLLAGFSGWFPQTIVPPRLPAGATCLSRGSTDVIGWPGTGLVTLAAYHDEQARPSDVDGVPVIDASALGSAELRGVVKTYLARRRAGAHAAKIGTSAKPIADAAPPPGNVHRHRRRLRPTGR